MRFRSTYVLLGIFVVLGGYVYFAEYRGHDRREQQEAAKKKLFPTPLKDVTELSLVFPDHKISAVKKDDKHWEITEPKGIDPDTEAWDMLASSLSQIEKEGTVVTAGAGSADLAPFGLDKPAVEVVAKLKDGHSIGVQFGAENPKKTENYARLSDGTEVFLSPSSWSKTFEKSLTDLRNKKVLDFKVDDIDLVRIDNGKDSIELQKNGKDGKDGKDGMDWQLKKPSDLKADAAEVSSFLSAIDSARAAEFATDAITIANAGLNPSASRITLHDGKANADRVLSIGKSPVPDKYYAKSDSSPAIMIIDKDVPEKARRPVTDWRDKSIAHFEPENVDEIEIVRGTEKISVKRQGDNWKLADGRKAQSEKISNLVFALAFGRASQAIDAPGNPATYGLDKPRLEVTLRAAGKDLVVLKFGSAVKNPDGSYLQVSSNPAVLKVGADIYEKLSIKADDIAETQPAKK